jgi:hypothetical protein
MGYNTITMGVLYQLSYNGFQGAAGKNFCAGSGNVTIFPLIFQTLTTATTRNNMVANFR